MISLPFFQIDAFASKAFEGNQACVMPLDAFLPDETLQAIAAENNVAETAYIVPASEGVWKLRWFTPAVEVPLCGHATLAAAHVLFNHLSFAGEEIAFDTRQSGRLTVRRADGEGLEMDFPASPYEEIDVPDWMTKALGMAPVKAWRGPYFACELGSAADIVAVQPDLSIVKPQYVDEGHPEGTLGCFARSSGEYDIVSRFFAPGAGIDEDPATGSWHCLLAPIVGAKSLKCYQAYPGRGAKIGVELAGERVKLRGNAVTVIEGRFSL